MNAKPLTIAVVVLLFMGVATGMLIHTKSSHKLGEPGVKTRPLAGTQNLEIILPETIPGYRSKIEPEAQIVLDKLPKDTSYGQRLYTSEDGNFIAQVNVVLMGTDRSSIHKPQICLTGQGWACDYQATRVEKVPMEKPFSYDLPVNKYVATQQVENNGRTQTVRGLYVYWYVDGTHYTAKQWQWMSWWVPRDLILNGLLERWAYISFFTTCSPGQEDAVFARIKDLMGKIVPEFQLVPKSAQK